jgi:hypothetical protein
MSEEMKTIGWIDLRGALVYQKSGAFFNQELANSLRYLDAKYQVDFRIYTNDSHREFDEDFGFVTFWNDYAHHAGLNNIAVFRDGIFDISENQPALVKDSFSKENPKDYAKAQAYLGMKSNGRFLLDDASSNRKAAKVAKIKAINSLDPDYLSSITVFVSNRAVPK